MERTDNYAIQTRSAQDRFLTYDQGALIAKFSLPFDETYLYPTMLASRYRLHRKTGDLQRRTAEGWQNANTFNEVMTLLDMLCDARADRGLTGRWKSMQAFGLQFHQNLLEDRRDNWAEQFDRDPVLLRRGCEALGGIPLPGGDVGYAVELFDGLRIGVQFWHGDEEFFPRLRYLWDENALQYIRYETMYYAVGLLLQRIAEAGKQI